MLPKARLPSGFSPSPYPIPVFSRSFGSWRLSVERSPFEQDILAEHYNKKSKRWHHIIERHGFLSAYQGLIARVLRQRRYQQDTNSLRVLDAGVGTGAMSSALRAHVGKRFRLDAIDISVDMLQQAKERLEAQDIEFRLRRGTLNDLPYADNSFDIVLAAHVIEHLPDPLLALSEMYRVLKPGGILISSVTRPSFVGALVQLIWRTHRVSQNTALEWLSGSGLRSVRAIPLERHSSAYKFSLGYVGRKTIAC